MNERNDSADPDTTIDRRVLHRVRALLAKAESTGFPDEAAALTAKAQELMAVHAIDQALLESRRGHGEVTSIRLVMEAPYAKQKVSLVSAVAGPNRCQVVLSTGPGNRGRPDRLAGRKPPVVAIVFGYPADLAIVETLFTSLLLQAVRLMLAHGSMVDERGENRTRSFRGSFILGFADTIARRLTEVQERFDQRVDDREGGALLPVLQRRRDDVDSAIEAEFPHLTTYSASVSNGRGLQAGQAAGRRADLGGRAVVNRRRSLPR